MALIFRLSKDMYGLNFPFWFMHFSKGSSRNIWAVETWLNLYKCLGDFFEGCYWEVHIEFYSWPYLHLTEKHICTCTDWVDEHVMSSLNIFVVLRELSFSRAMHCLNCHFKQILCKMFHLSRCPELPWIGFPLTPLFTLLITFSLCKYRKMILYMLLALFSFHIYEIENNSERKYRMSEC